MEAVAAVTEAVRRTRPRVAALVLEARARIHERGLAVARDRLAHVARGRFARADLLLARARFFLELTFVGVKTTVGT